MENLKSVLKIVGTAAALAVVGGSVYLMQNQNAKKQIGKKVLKTMDSAEAMVAKKTNN